MFESLPQRKTKQLTPEGVSCFVVGEDGFEPSKRYAADLQSGYGEKLELFIIKNGHNPCKSMEFKTLQNSDLLEN